MQKNNELLVIKKAKDLSNYIFKITQNSPKKFRFSLISKLQNYSLDLIDCLNKANKTFIDIKLLKDIDVSINAANSKIKNINNIEEIYYLKDKILTLKLTKATKIDERVNKRIDLQHESINLLQKLDHLTLVAKDMYCIQNKHQQHIAKLLTEIRKMVYKWIQSDKKRYNY